MRPIEQPATDADEKGGAPQALLSVFKNVLRLNNRDAAPGPVISGPSNVRCGRRPASSAPAIRGAQANASMDLCMCACV